MRTMDDDQNAVCSLAVCGNSTTELSVPEPMLAPTRRCKHGPQNSPIFRIAEQPVALPVITK